MPHNFKHYRSNAFHTCYLIVLLLFTVQVGPAQKPRAKSDGFRVAAYNIRYDSKADVETGNGWQLRKKPVADLILRHGFDIVGTQEGNAKQLEELKELLPGYDYLGKPYGGPDGLLHNCATYYKSDQFRAIDSGVFWFSETPDVPSLGWDAHDRRISHWVKFEERTTSRQFFFFNVHFYFRYQLARQNSGPLLVQKIKEIAGSAPVIVTGDFNSEPETSQIQVVKARLVDAYDATRSERTGPEGTCFAGGVFEGEPKGRIDYIFVSKDFIVNDYQVLNDKYDGARYPSDHLPVTSFLRWAGQ